MNVLTWVETRARQFTWLDFGVFKIYIGSAVLLLAKLWPALLDLNWYWYALVFMLSGFWVFARILK